MNSFGKVMVVFVTATSLGFAAFALSLVTGGPNWRAEAESEELLKDFTFTTTAVPDSKPTYAAKTRRTGEAVGQATTLLAEAVVSARQRQVKDAKEKEAALQAEIAKIKPQIAEINALIPVDEAGLAARTVLLDKLLSKLNEEIQTTSAAFTAKATEIKQIRKTGEERRDEGYRLRNQLELMRTDLFVAQAQQKILEDELVRVEENLKRLQRREQQLKKQIGNYE
jgi:chromosome segregation ATPase